MRPIAPDPREGLPPVWPGALLGRIRRRGRHRTVLVLDDDPTGTQTVRGVPILIDPTIDDLTGVLEARTPLVFILTNSRSLAEDRAVGLARRLGRLIGRASRTTGRPVSLVSRSDSTLRGHFPAEVDALADGLGLGDAPVLLMPYLGDAGRLTIADVHHVVRDGILVPVAETEYARDPAFGYTASDLPTWVATRLGPDRRQIARVSLDLIRAGGPSAVAAELRRLPARAVCIVNAADDRDAEVVAAAMVDVEMERPILVRSAAGYVRARAGQARRSDLGPGELRIRSGPGLVVVGSHVPMTTRQLERLVEDPPAPLELVEIPAGAANDPRRAARVRRAATARVVELLAADVIPIVATSRTLIESGVHDPSGLRLAARVSRLLVGVVADLPRPPAWVLAKGGITSSDVVTRGLGGRSATVVGQLLPGVPVWRVHVARNRPLLLVVFPGNVGDTDGVRSAVASLVAAAGEEKRAAIGPLARGADEAVAGPPVVPGTPVVPSGQDAGRAGTPVVPSGRRVRPGPG
jgi:uncharacterized protein YgbK (DUF1537 family)